MADSAAQRKAFLEGLKDLIWKTFELEETVKNFGEGTQEILEERLVQYSGSIRSLAATAPAFEGVRVPTDLLQYMDEGGNPNQYTAEVFQGCTRDNQAAKGKVAAVACLRDTLLSSLEKEAPAEVAEYKAALSAHAAATSQS
uniref:Mediator of RNA polymerase II transcription subunit 10 n=1 Tax=Chlamydomonas leiostraca TaxID=1034604 RepID=A0A7S0QZP0_9CHLO|mmetsp:Transcript_10931/g.26881  ORF Transcript_10931/g.26881 Transcript_10931/m.26881 type:complete len:142 (+) Transcript_10931:97-522(+)